MYSTDGNEKEITLKTKAAALQKEQPLLFYTSNQSLLSKTRGGLFLRKDDLLVNF